MKADNAAGLAQLDIDGALVGGASLKAESFARSSLRSVHNKTGARMGIETSNWC